MSKSNEFTFSDDSVASGYDNGLVPVLFDPWAKGLVEAHGPWSGRRVLDLATGTGIVAEHLAKAVGTAGSVLGADINAEMMGLAKQRCEGLPVEFVETPAHPLDVPSDSVDFAVCQQGFQFFPDKPAAAQEIFRVLRPGARTVVTTWRSVSECEFFGALCDTLDGLGEAETAEMMRTPFKMHEPDLLGSFAPAGFVDAKLERHELTMVVSGGVTHAVKVAYSTPIGPRLRAMSEDLQSRFRTALSDRLGALSPDGTSMGRMTSSVLTAAKPG